MSSLIYLDSKLFKIIADSASVREHDAYRRIREQINRNSTPLASSIDWKLVKQLCEELAQQGGIDLVVCGYYTIAAMKIQGLQGFANGIELMGLSLSHQDEFSLKKAKAKKELIDWVIARAVKELKALKPNYELLRELYRCEFNCSRIHDVLQNDQPQQMPNIETLAFIIFEHIDRLETSSHSKIQNDILHHVQETKKKHKAHITGALFGALSIMLVTTIQSHLFPQSKEIPTPLLKNVEQVTAFKTELTEKQVEELKPRVVSFYTDMIHQNLERPFFAPRMDALAFSNSLKHLYPEDEGVGSLHLAVEQSKQAALEENHRYMMRFSQARTQVANLSLLAQKGNLKELRIETKSLEDLAVSLSPIYGRTIYIDQLLADGESEEAQQELSILNHRLEALSWKLAETKQQLTDSRNALAK